MANRALLIDVARAGDFERWRRTYEWALPRLPEMLTNLDRWRHLWADEDAHLATSLQALAGDDVRVTEHPDVDLAIVDVVSATSAHQCIGSPVASRQPSTRWP